MQSGQLQLLKKVPEVLNETKFTIAGKMGDGVARLKELISEEQLENFIEIRLNLTEKEKVFFTKGTDLLLAPSAMEGFGNATLEAMS